MREDNLKSNFTFVLFQVYVGGNAALIGQKLATYPDLMVQ